MHYADHLPFNRIARIFAREGLTIDHGVLSRVSMRVADAPRLVVDAMERAVIA